MNINTKILNKILAYENHMLFFPGMQRWFKFNDYFSAGVGKLYLQDQIWPTIFFCAASELRMDIIF